jgi:hypothetical protein
MEFGVIVYNAASISDNMSLFARTAIFPIAPWQLRGRILPNGDCYYEAESHIHTIVLNVIGGRMLANRDRTC